MASAVTEEVDGLSRRSVLSLAAVPLVSSSQPRSALRRCAGVALTLAAACGGSTSPGSASGTFQVRIPAGLSLVQGAFASERALRGLITVTRTGSSGARPVPGAQVKLAGVAVPESPLLAGSYDVALAPGLIIAPGDAVSLVAVEGGDQATVTFGCPAQVAIIAPSDRSTVDAGASIAVAWSGRVGYSSQAFMPALSLRSWDPALDLGGAPYDASSSTGVFQALAAGAAGATLSLPPDGKAGYAVELTVPGNFADQSSSGGQAICVLVRRAKVAAR